MSAGTFEIVVKGKVSPTVLLALDGLEVSRYDEGKTCLVGWVPDQARLHGLLAIFRDLNMELVGFRAVESLDQVPKA